MWAKCFRPFPPTILPATAANISTCIVEYFHFTITYADRHINSRSAKQIYLLLSLFYSLIVFCFVLFYFAASNVALLSLLLLLRILFSSTTNFSIFSNKKNAIYRVVLCLMLFVVVARRWHKSSLARYLFNVIVFVLYIHIYIFFLVLCHTMYLFILLFLLLLFIVFFCHASLIIGHFLYFVISVW